MKIALCILIASIMLLGLAGCGSGESSNIEATSKLVEEQKEEIPDAQNCVYKELRNNHGRNCVVDCENGVISAVYWYEGIDSTDALSASTWKKFKDLEKWEYESLQQELKNHRSTEKIDLCLVSDENRNLVFAEIDSHGKLIDYTKYMKAKPPR